MRKTLLSSFLVLCMAFTFLPATALAASLPPSAPAVALAPLVDHSGDPQANLAASYTYSVREDTAGVTVKFAATDLQPHQGAGSYAIGADTQTVGYWVGMGIQQPESGVTAKYACGTGAYAQPSTFDLTPASTYTIGADTDAVTYDTFYFNAFPQDASSRPDWIAAQYSLDSQTGTNPVVFVYHLDFSGVEAPANVEVTPSVAGGTAAATVPETITGSIAAAETSADKTLTIQATTTGGANSVETAKVTLPGGVVDALAEADQVSTAIATDLGTVTLPNAALAQVKEGAQSGSSTSAVTLEVGKATVEGTAAAFEVKFTANGSEVPVSNLSSPITLAFSFDNTTASISDPVLAYVNQSGGDPVYELLSGGKYENGIISGQTTHLSTFAVVSRSDVVQSPSIEGIGAEVAGGAGLTRTITCSGNLDGRYLVIQITEGSGEAAKVSVVMIEAGTTVTVSYQNTASLYVLLTDKMPNLTGTDPTGATIYDSERTTGS